MSWESLKNTVTELEEVSIRIAVFISLLFYLLNLLWRKYQEFKKLVRKS